MDKSIKGCLINAGYGGWYSKGSERLERSLIYHGWSYDMFFWRDQPINEHFNPERPYTIKAAALAEALRMGYTRIIWADCSVWAVKDPNPLMDMVNEQAAYFCTSGYNLAQTATDTDLEFAGLTRDEAEKMPDISSGLFGINIENPKGQVFVDTFFRAKEAGVFNTSRNHDGGSQDPRFLHARQDQTAATIAFHKAGLEKLHHFGEHWDYYPNNLEKVMFTMRGM